MFTNLFKKMEEAFTCLRSAAKPDDFCALIYTCDYML